MRPVEWFGAGAGPVGTGWVFWGEGALTPVRLDGGKGPFTSQAKASDGGKGPFTQDGQGAWTGRAHGRAGRLGSVRMAGLGQRPGTGLGLTREEQGCARRVFRYAA